jgi:hypothetical protein
MGLSQRIVMCCRVSGILEVVAEKQNMRFEIFEPFKLDKHIRRNTTNVLTALR